MKPLQYPEIDVVRGVAMVCMLISHAASSWMGLYDNTHGVSGFVAFVGSFAPVFFFLATGLGYGVSYEKTGAIKDVLFKALILVVMDMFMRQEFSLFAGWDFLAFIGFSMVILHVLRCSRYSLFLAILLLLLLFFGRYVLDVIGFCAYFFSNVKDSCERLIGVQGFSGVSYWFFPWLSYSIIGYIAGLMLKKFASIFDDNKALFLTLIVCSGLLLIIASIILAGKGYQYFRWGTVSVNFFIVSIGAVLVVLGCAWLSTQCKDSYIVNRLMLKGPVSLILVPVHYFFLAVLSYFLPYEKTSFFFFLAIPVFIFCSWFCSDRLAGALRELSLRLSRVSSGVLVLVVCSLAIYVDSLDLVLLSVILVFFAQLVLCTMLIGAQKLLYNVP